MTIVQQAAKRLEELRRAGVAVPDVAALRANGTHGMENGHAELRPALAPPVDPAPAAAMRRLSAEAGNAANARVVPNRGPAVDGAAVSVTLDLERLERSGYLVPASTRSVQAEEFRHIKRPLLKNARSKGGALLSQIMVTSALPGEGKTFCSINLAMSMASEIDTSVLLVDADVLHPTVLQRLGVPEKKGLLDILSDPALCLADVVLATNVPKLSILPAGKPNDRSTELLASNAMEELLVKLADLYPNHIVIFDAPPLLLTNEAKVLASRIGQVVLVVEAAKTPRSVVAQAFAAVEQCPVVVSVLNKALQSSTPLGYGYYHGAG